jgi:peptidoglycan/LPS O-acetylase OafA/YrhL
LAGDLSYPIYICHGPVETVIQAVGLHEQVPLWTWIAANVLIVVIVAALLLLATAPFEKFRLRFKSKKSLASPSGQLSSRRDV